MPQVSFDTHAAARKLEKAGHTARQAQAVVEVVSTATGFGIRIAQDVERIKLLMENTMATKADIAELRAVTANMATKDDIAELKADAEHKATKSDIANMATKDDIAELKAVTANMATKDDIAELKADAEHKATKSDIANMATKDDIAELKADAEHKATKSDIANMATKDDIAELKAVTAHMATKSDIANMATKDDLAELREVIRGDTRHEIVMAQNRWALSAGSISFSIAGLALAVFSNDLLATILLEYGGFIGPGLIILASATLIFLFRQK